MHKITNKLSRTYNSCAASIAPPEYVYAVGKTRKENE